MNTTQTLRTLTLAAAFAAAPGAALATTLDHIRIATSSTIESVKWYTEYLNCSADEARREVVTCGEVSIEFVARTTLGGSQGTGINRLGFAYPDVQAKMDALESAGVGGAGVRLQRFADGSTLQPDAGFGNHGFIFDPWGTRIELIESADVSGVHHIYLQSVDAEATLAWYAEQLGAEIEAANEAHRGIQIGNTWLFVETYPGDHRPAATDERAIRYIGFGTADIDAAANALKAADVNVQAPTVPERARSEARRAMVAAPDGVLIALIESGWAGIEPSISLATANVGETEPYDAPMTPWGEPDLQGVWTGNGAHGIPLERPEDLAEGEELSTEEAAARRERGTLRSIWGYEREWRDTTIGYDKIEVSTRPAMIIDPPNGRMPPMTEAGQARIDAIREARYNPKLAGGPEDLSNWVRCITKGLPGMMMPSVYNNGLQIVQSPGNVAIQKEMIHETRVIPTTPKDEIDGNIRQWLGNSRGHWEGDTLVIEVKGFNGRDSFQGSSDALTLTERYRRIGPDTLEYTFTVDDPETWTAPWTAQFNFRKDDSQYELVEYACHEGNYGMFNILSGARAKEREAAQNNDYAGD